jgi:rRNA maturation endonuclease Nob1
MQETICLLCNKRFDDLELKICPNCGSDDLGLIGKDQKLIRI